MQKKKKLGILVAVIYVAAGILLVWGMLGRMKVTVECYFYDPCGGCFSEAGPCKPCPVEKELGQRYMELIAKNGLESTVDFKLYNVLYKVYQQKYETKMNKNLWVSRERNFPVVFVGNAYMIGEREIESRLVSTIASAGSPLQKIVLFAQSQSSRLFSSNQKKVQVTEENSIIYFSVPGCEDCERVGEYLDRLKKGSFKNNDFNLITYSIDTEKNISLLKQYSHLYGVEKNETVVPVIFVGDKYLEGYEQIAAYLKNILIQGEGIHTKVIRVGADD